MNYWLMKSEPGCFNMDDLKKCPKQTEPWDGVRNYQVRNMMRDEMKVGDKAFFYYSNANPSGIAGIMEIVSEAYPDQSAFDPNEKHYDSKSNPDKPTWLLVDVKFVKKFKRIITLQELRAEPLLEEMWILRPGSRLSITPVSKTEWDTILALE